MPLTFKDLTSEKEKDEFDFKLKLTKKELTYLYALLYREFKHCIEIENKSDITDVIGKQHFLLGVMIKMKNKLWELE